MIPGRKLRIPADIAMTALLLMMLGLMVSGIVLSREVFAFLPISGGTSFARMLHMVCAYWGFCLMSLHIGIHWGIVLRKLLSRVNFPMKGKFVEYVFKF